MDDKRDHILTMLNYVRSEAQKAQLPFTAYLVDMAIADLRSSIRASQSVAIRADSQGQSRAPGEGG